MLRDGADQVYLTSMTDLELLARYRTTREALLVVCGRESSCSEEERRAAMQQHGETLALINTRFPDIKFAHSTAEWHLRQAIEANASE